MDWIAQMDTITLGILLVIAAVICIIITDQVMAARNHGELWAPARPYSEA
jgi:hypothetical protein